MQGCVPSRHEFPACPDSHMATLVRTRRSHETMDDARRHFTTEAARFFRPVGRRSLQSPRERVVQSSRVKPLTSHWLDCESFELPSDRLSDEAACKYHVCNQRGMTDRHKPLWCYAVRAEPVHPTQSTILVFTAHGFIAVLSPCYRYALPAWDSRHRAHGRACSVTVVHMYPARF